MEDYPKTLLDFEARFSTDAACREYLSRLRWPEGFRCPRGEGARSGSTNRGLPHCLHCDVQTSVIAGTIFQDTKKPLRLWFRARGSVTSQKYGVRALGRQRVLGLGSSRTAWTWLDKLRRALMRPGRDRLSGTVEVDETHLGGERETRSRSRGQGTGRDRGATGRRANRPHPPETGSRRLGSQSGGCRAGGCRARKHDPHRGLVWLPIPLHGRLYAPSRPCHGQCR